MGRDLIGGPILFNLYVSPGEVGGSLLDNQRIGLKPCQQL